MFDKIAMGQNKYRTDHLNNTQRMAFTVTQAQKTLRSSRGTLRTSQITKRGHNRYQTIDST